ncbi:MAG TPA: 2-amino-4-hydroxy-6-hydroxymethyldihydropteridine diphosphokinase, partial [Burkholderiales bacterium]|nr:2-amino-4-hydroxy-6-hydroxymethyldihydropteridine diphosphokinase [Burkholderiales bacterium]
LETELPAQQLLAELQAIEKQHGRSRSFPNAPRTLDLDLLLFGSAVIDAPGLTVPHPRMHERAFVLEPLVEIEPLVTIPGRGPARDWLLRCKGQVVERIG